MACLVKTPITFVVITRLLDLVAAADLLGAWRVGARLAPLAEHGSRGRRALGSGARIQAHVGHEHRGSLLGVVAEPARLVVAEVVLRTRRGGVACQLVGAQKVGGRRRRGGGEW